MSHSTYSFINCVGEIPEKPALSAGRVQVSNAAVSDTVYLCGNKNTEITVTGGAHLIFNVRVGAYNFSGDPTLLNNRYNTLNDADRVFRVDVGGNVCAYESSIISNPSNTGSPMRDAAVLNLHLRGSWSMSDVHLWGNVGFDLETRKRIPLGFLMDVHLSSLVKLAELGYPAEVPEIILNHVKLDYSLWQLVEEFGNKDISERIYRNTLHAAQQVLRSGCVINQFCAFKDVHSRPNCRCALYYPLLLELNPLALTYFVKAGEHTRKLGTYMHANLTNSQIEDALDDIILDRYAARTNYGRLKMEDTVKVVRRVTPARFEKFLKTAGIKEPKMLWRAP